MAKTVKDKSMHYGRKRTAFNIALKGDIHQKYTQSLHNKE
jgi:hypothetical protein